MNNISVEHVLMSNYIKYDYLSELTKKAFIGSDAENINIYIDLYQMLLSIYKPNVVIEDYSSITSTVINLCAHMRSYFRTRHQVDSKIFIVYSDNMSRNNIQFNRDYNLNNNNKIIANKKMYDNVCRNLELLDLLCPYLPNIHFIKRSVEPAVIIYDCICKQEVFKNTNPNLILGRSIFNYQLSAIHQNTVIYRINRRVLTKTDDYRYINFQNVLREYIYETKENNDLSVDNLNPGLLSLIMSLNNLPSRNIKYLMQIESVIKLLNILISQGSILNAYNHDINWVYQKICEVRKVKFDKIVLENRFKSIDLLYQHLIYMNDIESKDDRYLLNLDDPDSVRSINNEYFVKNPLDLMRL